MKEETKFKVEFEGRLWERKHLIYYLYLNQEKYGGLSYQKIAELVSTNNSSVSKQRVAKVIEEFKEKENSKEASIILKASGNLKFQAYEPNVLPTEQDFKELLIKNVHEALSGLEQIRKELRASKDTTIKQHIQFELNVLKILGPYANLLEKGNKA